jgi:hypothetical protein
MIALHNDEKILGEMRRHWIVLAGHLVPFLVVIFVPVALWFGLAFLDPGEARGSLEALFGFVVLAWLLTAWIAVFVVWTNYFLDVLIITDHRLVDIEQHSFFSRNVSECFVDKIEDVTVDVHGLLPTFFDFGDIHIQTAGESPRFVLRHMPRPHETKDLIIRARQGLHQKRELHD